MLLDCRENSNLNPFCSLCTARIELSPQHGTNSMAGQALSTRSLESPHSEKAHALTDSDRCFLQAVQEAADVGFKQMSRGLLYSQFGLTHISEDAQTNSKGSIHSDAK